MQKKQTAWRRELSLSGPYPACNREAELLNLVYALSTELQANPRLYTAGDSQLWASYNHAGLDAETLLDTYGEAIAFVSASYPFSVYGNVRELEGGELAARFSESRKLVLIKRDVSGVNFDTMEDICLKISFPDQEITEEFRRILTALDFQSPYLAMERTPYTERAFADYPQLNEDAYFRYLPMVEGGGEDYLTSLPVELLKQLWLLFLKERVSPLEFDDAFAFLRAEEIPAFPWELSLRLALGETGVSVCYGESGFQITNRRGEKMTFSFESSASAEKLLLKLLFPHEPGSTRFS